MSRDRDRTEELDDTPPPWWAEEDRLERDRSRDHLFTEEENAEADAVWAALSRLEVEPPP